ncbi:uncharacterized protein CC84DRAFT_1212722 [Paraphaeosphaeria sporulosa]|uniref:Uncharacterized protein n=1 Tax=Paraphaeosphaeria sporulosa TaxID=1460663 RepID=A0A177CP27_9PLEO|nr:uncharacterized protein CC84DRAFT_1212722 [Paraphaeosphaeria sporulosa]OAG09273.1 hypothetical protein CC84DRAFT_1212722 [Paraphaeosphaeria sporulosa]
MKFLATFAAVALCALVAAAPAPVPAPFEVKDISTRGAPVDPATGSDLAENAIVWIILAYSDEAEGSDTLTKREEPTEPLTRESEIILLLVKAYGDEVPEADKLDKRGLHELARRAAVPEEKLTNENEIILLLVKAYGDEVEGADVAKRGVTAKQMSAAKRALIQKLRA